MEGSEKTISYIGRSNKNTTLQDGHVINGVWTVVNLTSVVGHDNVKARKLCKLFSEKLGVNTRYIANSCYIKGKWEDSIIDTIISEDNCVVAV